MQGREFKSPSAAGRTRTAAVRVLFFGRVADALGREVELALPAQGCRLSDLRERLSALGEAAREALSRCDVRAAVDQMIADDASWVHPRQEVAFFSLFSGG